MTSEHSVKEFKANDAYPFELGVNCKAKRFHILCEVCFSHNLSLIWQRDFCETHKFGDTLNQSTDSICESLLRQDIDLITQDTMSLERQETVYQELQISTVGSATNSANTGSSTTIRDFDNRIKFAAPKSKHNQIRHFLASLAAVVSILGVMFACFHFISMSVVIDEECSCDLSR